MKHYSKLLLVIITAVTISGCNILGDKEPSEELVGMWSGPALVSQYGSDNVEMRYIFSDIKNYSLSVFERDSAGYVIGYLAYERGKYKLEGNRLIMNAGVRYLSNEGNLYPQVEDLISSADPTDPTYEKYSTKFEMIDNVEYVTLYPDCPFNAGCVSYKLKNQHVIFN